ncbi:adhesion G protein-coupled receptor E1-like [Acropora muricata]|uniref:adhesion G protein-coupled receptor E1-like n=1 Tax=Acropora muricata TaxID=159855 RepID=UPI0034E5D0C8
MKSFAHLFLLMILVLVDFSSSQTCRSLKFWQRAEGDSNCGRTEYLKGFYRDANQGEKDVIDLLRNASCCTAPPPDENSGQNCVPINLWKKLNPNNVWVTCPPGMFMQGLKRSTNQFPWLSNIEGMLCCYPKDVTPSYEDCHEKNVLFNDQGWSTCDPDYYLAGFHRGNCKYLSCLDQFKCCKFKRRVKTECELRGITCDIKSTCVKSEGSYICRCKPGFQSAKDNGKDCSDVNECEKGDTCGEVANCENTEGSYKCICFSKGFEYNAKRRGCFDIDECKKPNICGPHKKCSNQPATFVCLCTQGYEYKDRTKLNCTDIDECMAQTYKCVPNSYCSNTIGSYGCTCKEGFKMNDKGICEEQCFDECPENSECRDGRCQCLPGFALGPYRHCYEDSFLFTRDSSGICLHHPIIPLAFVILTCQALL